MKKIMTINGKRVEIILPRGMEASEVPNELWTIKKKIKNVGIREDQHLDIKNLIFEKKLDLSINKIVQLAVDRLLNDDVSVLLDEVNKKEVKNED